jgi:hypothetical protein
MTAATAAYPKPVSRAAFETFARDDPIGAQLVIERGRIVVIDEHQPGENHERK